MRKLIFLDDSELTNMLHLKMAGLSGSHLSKTVAFIEPEKAVKSMKNHNDPFEVNIIFVDLNMPNQHGLEFIKTYRSVMDEQHFLPVPLSGKYKPEEKEMITEMGLPVALHKPLTQSLLARALILTYRLENLSQEETIWLNSRAVDKNKIQQDLLPELVKELQTDYERVVSQGVREKQRVKDWAHKVKGTTKLYGEDTISQLAGAIENQALDAGDEELTVWIRQVGNEIRRLAASL
jgi:response regulator RpfG family c-di-GMP phosphodiesterase